ncbi:MAG TPA: MBOAT family O-acyltransferase [Candidatus Elarobacter sp.]|jgi:alginate O-acetyltransferase complex protein AlgI|nr:MBOAT family O-acyltransferase [Candidatus Elarobacter sp.]
MIFNTWTFAAFALVVLAVYWTIVPRRWRPVALVVFGAVFYAFSVPAYLVLLAVLGGVTYALGIALLRTRSVPARKALLATGVTLIVGVLVFFKYTKFLALTVDQIAHTAIVPVPVIVVPLAISFFTFEFVHVLVDIYLGKIERLDALDFVVFMMFFPTLVAGPIKRYQSFAPQVHTLREPDRATFLLNFYRVAIGVAKKTVLADSMAVFVQPILTPGPPFGQLDYVLAALAYAAKIYFDFSGYSDIAIGVAGLLGFAIPENFERPYWSRNISVFWRRWHISLSAWIRDYVFIPLGGSRRNPVVTAANLFLAMALAGLWHGANWTFVLWGLWHGLGLAVHRVWSSAVVPRADWLARPSAGLEAVSVVMTFGFVVTGWLLFAAPTLGAALAAFRGMF